MLATSPTFTHLDAIVILGLDAKPLQEFCFMVVKSLFHTVVAAWSNDALPELDFSCNLHDPVTHTSGWDINSTVLVT